MYDGYRGPGPGSILFAFLLGGAIGALIGILFAPKSGKETREIIVDKSQGYYDQGKEMYQTGVDRASEMYESGKQSATEGYGKARSKISKQEDAATGKGDAGPAQA